MAEGLNSQLSPADIKKFNTAVKELVELNDQRETVVKKVLSGEIEIGKTRIAYLTKFFDEYSAGLDSIIAKKASSLNETFLILEKQAVSQFKSEAEEARKEAEAAAKKSSGGGSDNGGTGGGGNSGGKKPPSIDASTRAQLKANDDEEDLGPSASEIEAGIEMRREALRTLTELADVYRRNEEESEMALLERSKNREAELQSFRLQQAEQLAARRRSIENDIIELNNSRSRDQIDIENNVIAARLDGVQKVLDAEKAAQRLRNEMEAELAYYSSENIIDKDGNDTGTNEAGAMRVRMVQAQAEEKVLTKLKEDRAAYIAKREMELARKNDGILTAEAATRARKEAAEKFKLDQENIRKLAEEEQKQKAKNALEEEIQSGLSNLTGKGVSFNDKKQALYDLTHDSEGNFDGKKTGAVAVKALESGIKALADLAQQLEDKIVSISGKKGAIDTRLQGSSNKRTALGSYWDQLVKDMTSVGAVNPFFKQETFASNIEALVNKGISFDLKQRAFLMTIQDKIAGTFEVTSNTLLRLVRIQQEDSTAGRLGMESALNAFLNEMYETSEYLEGVAGSVRDSLNEMESLMQGAEAAEVEWQVQKWLGSLYSVGMSDAAVNSIATSLGQIAAGQIEGLTGGGAGNLLVMAANDAGVPIADILTDGINASDTNKLMQAVVNYLAELAESAKDNKIVQQQLANVFGVKASDLRAATNLVSQSSVSNIFNNSMTYNNMMSRLSEMAGSMWQRTSTAEMMTNFWENGSYTLAGGMASNPVSYFIYKMAKVVDEAAGGIDLPFLNVMGFGVDLNTTVSDLMRLAAVGGGLLGSIGPMISGLGSSFSGVAMLNKLGIGTGSGLAVTPRGGAGGGNIGAAGGTASESGGSFAGNSSGSDIKDSTIQESEDSKKQQMIEAKEEEESNQVDVLNTTVIKIYELLDDVTKGKATFRVKVDGYGLTKAGSSNSSALAGVAALNNLNGGGASQLGAGGLSSSSIGGSVDAGGWILSTL